MVDFRKIACERCVLLKGALLWRIKQSEPFLTATSWLTRKMQRSLLLLCRCGPGTPWTWPIGRFHGVQSFRRGGIVHDWCIYAPEVLSCIQSASIKRRDFWGDCGHRKRQFCLFLFSWTLAKMCKPVLWFIKRSYFDKLTSLFRATWQCLKSSWQ